MISKTLNEAFPDTTMDDFLSENPEVREQAEAFRLEQAENGRLAGYFRQEQEKIEAEKQSLNWLDGRLSLYEGSNIPASMLQTMRASGNGYLSLENMAVNMAAAVLLKQIAPELRNLAWKDLAETEAKFEVFKKENAAVLKKLGLI